jgi:hypothetical protein
MGRRAPHCHISVEPPPHQGDHLRVFGCACYPNLSAKAAHKLAPRSTRCIFLRYSVDHKGYQFLDLTTNNIIVSQHVVFYKVDFPFSISPRLTNDLDIFLQDDSPGAAPMLAPLSAPYVPLGFPLVAAAGNQTTRPGGQIMPITRVGGQTVSPSGQNAPRIEAGGLTVSLSGQTAPCTEAGGPTARPCVAPSSLASPTLAALRAAPTTSARPHAAPSTPPVLRAAPTSTSPAASPAAPVS